MEGFYEVLKSLFLIWKSFFEVFMKVFFKRLYEAYFEQLRVLFESPLWKPSFSLYESLHPFRDISPCRLRHFFAASIKILIFFSLNFINMYRNVASLRVIARNTLSRATLARVATTAPTAMRTMAYSVPRLNNTKLLSVLKAELDVAKEVDLSEGEKEISDFSKSSGFAISQDSDLAVVQLTRSLPSGETVRIFFDVEKVSNAAQSGAEFAEEEAEIEEDEEMGFSNVYAVVENSANKGLLFELTLQNFSDAFAISSITPVADVAQYVEKFAKRGVYYDDMTYQGPEFMNLDESLQIEFESYLKERGFDQNLLEFIIFLSEHREEIEYRGWLQKVREIVE